MASTTRSSVVPSSIRSSSSISTVPTVPFVYVTSSVDTRITTITYNPTSFGTVLGYTTLITVGGRTSLSTFTWGALPPSGVPISNNSSSATGVTASSVTSPTNQTSKATSTLQTTVPPNAVKRPQTSNGLQDHAGEVAGIAIGTALALAFITFVITFVVMRRKQHSTGTPRHHGEKANNSYLSAGSIGDSPSDHGSKQPIVTDQSVVSGPARGLDTHLPPSADDSTVRNKISTLYEQIGLHVENFYHKSAISVPPGAEAELADFESPYLPGKLALLLQQARSGVPIIKHCLTGLILSRTSPSGDPKNTFLPIEFVGLPHALEKTRSSKQKAPGYDEALSRWRVLSSYLMPHPSTLSSYVSSRDAAIGQAVQSFSRAFRPWINSRYSDSDRVHNLTEIMKSAAEQGVWLFSQPSTFRFHWGNPEEVGGGAVLTSPALWKIGDERGQGLRKVQVMVEKGVGRT